METTSKPTIVLVPGAWHKVLQYTPLISRLERAGYEVHGVDYSSTGPNPTNANFDPDVAVVSNTIAKLADRGDNVMVVVHSAAGIIAGEAAEGLSKAERKKNGREGGIVRMVYICAFAAAEGVALWDATGGPDPWIIVDGAILHPDRPKEIFYNLCTPEVAEENARQLSCLARGLCESKPTYAAWKHIPSTYLICENDKAIPPAAQEAMVSQPGAKFDVVRCEGDHSPFLSLPDFTAEVVRRAAGEEL